MRTHACKPLRPPPAHAMYARVIIFEYYCESVMIMVLGKVLLRSYRGYREVLGGVLQRC